MPTHVALLRGINVGGRNRVAMADLREVVLGLGHTEVATYIQSGNVVFTSEEADTATIAAALERAIAEHLGVQPKVIVLTRAGGWTSPASWPGWSSSAASISPCWKSSTRRAGSGPAGMGSTAR